MSTYFEPGQCIEYYNPLREDKATAEILEVEQPRGMLVQFEDRARPTFIFFADRRWMEFIKLSPFPCPKKAV